MRSPQNFSSVGVHGSRFEYEALRLVFSHISLIRTRNHTPFFLWTPCSSRNILSKFQIFSQSVQPVPKVSVQLEFIGACLNLEHLGLFRSYLSHPNSELRTIFFMDFLFFKEYYFKISNFFSTSSTGPQSFNLARVHWSMSEFGALGLVLIISPSSELGITYHFFYGLLVLQGILSQNFNFFLNRLDRSLKFQFNQSSLDHV